jgi:hypothetical protein
MNQSVSSEEVPYTEVIKVVGQLCNLHKSMVLSELPNQGDYNGWTCSSDGEGKYTENFGKESILEICQFEVINLDL